MTGSWADRPLVALDVETTGVDPATDRIVEVAVVTLDPTGEPTDTYCTIVNPGVPVPDEAAAVHGITTERARLEGVEPELALAQIADRLYQVNIDETCLVMYNARFDWPMALAEARRHDVDLPEFCPILDPYLIDRMGDKYRRGTRKLFAVAEQYGVPLSEDDAHGALADAVAAGRIMQELARKYPSLARWDLARLWRQQVRWFEQWRDGYVEHRRKQGEPEFDIDTGWPIPCSTPEPVA